MYFDVETRGKVLVVGFGENMCKLLEIVTERKQGHRRCFFYRVDEETECLDLEKRREKWWAEVCLLSFLA